MIYRITTLLIVTLLAVGGAQHVSPARAVSMTTPNITVTVWNQTAAQLDPIAWLPDERPDILPRTFPWLIAPSQSQICTSFKVGNISDDWGFGSIAGCQWNYVIVHYVGKIAWPKSELVTFCSFSDDGFYLRLGGNVVIDDWELQDHLGDVCDGEGQYRFVANQSVSIDLWYYENNGEAMAELRYLEGAETYIVPSDRFVTGCDRSSRTRERCRPTR